MNSVPGVNCNRLKPDEEIDVYVQTEAVRSNVIVDLPSSFSLVE